MTTFLVCWYALGWAAVSAYCREEPYMTLQQFILLLLGGGLSLAILVRCYLEETAIIIWERKP